jgi:hypothetical protein
MIFSAFILIPPRSLRNAQGYAGGNKRYTPHGHFKKLYHRKGVKDIFSYILGSHFPNFENSG